MHLSIEQPSIHLTLVELEIVEAVREVQVATKLEHHLLLVHAKLYFFSALASWPPHLPLRCTPDRYEHAEATWDNRFMFRTHFLDKMYDYLDLKRINKTSLDISANGLGTNKPQRSHSQNHL